MKIISWNVNGLRAVHRKGNFKDVFKYDPDVLCVQETKASVSDLPDDLVNIEGYESFFSSSRTKKGYSGVALYTKKKPQRVETDMGIPEFDDEGRLIAAHFDNVVILTVYFPNGGMGPHRVAYKMRFYDAFLDYIEKIRSGGKGVIFCGDLNTAHEEIDLARPKENENNTGFLAEERAWIDEVLNHGYIDTYRYIHPNKEGAYSYWDLKTRARDRNVGWRLDYVFVSALLQQRLKDAFILKDVFGSDHCPTGIELL